MSVYVFAKETFCQVYFILFTFLKHKGQHRPIVVKRLIVENSIESRIDQLQEKKQLLFQSTVGGDAAALARLSEEDLKFLFVM